MYEELNSFDRNMSERYFVYKFVFTYNIKSIFKKQKSHVLL